MVEELDAVPSVNERVDIKVTAVSRLSEVCDSNINGTVSLDDVWVAIDNRRGKLLKWFKLFS